MPRPGQAGCSHMGQRSPLGKVTGIRPGAYANVSGTLPMLGRGVCFGIAAWREARWRQENVGQDGQQNELEPPAGRAILRPRTRMRHQAGILGCPSQMRSEAFQAWRGLLYG